MLYPCPQPLAYREWNGPHLKYLVWWRRRESREEWKNATTKWSKYYIYDADTFTAYDLKIQAVNDFGLGPESPVVTGFSGEDRKHIRRWSLPHSCHLRLRQVIRFLPGPLTAPLNLRVSDIESTQVTVHWDPVSRSSIMGELKEYKVCMIACSVGEVFRGHRTPRYPYPYPNAFLLTDLLLEGQQPAEVVVGQPGDEVSSISQQQWRTLRRCHRPLPIQQLQDVHSGCKQSI